MTDPNIPAPSREAVKLTKAQRRCLEFLATRGTFGARSGAIGEAMSDRPHLRSQGAGRLGGAMCACLEKRGLTVNSSSHYGGFPGWAITPAGRSALQAEGER